jgi:hypothetical protein
MKNEKKELRIEVGKKYVTKGGSIVEIVYDMKKAVAGHSRFIGVIDNGAGYFHNCEFNDLGEAHTRDSTDGDYYDTETETMKSYYDIEAEAVMVDAVIVKTEGGKFERQKGYLHLMKRLYHKVFVESK